MIVAYAIIILIILALILRRDLSALAHIPYRGGWKVATAVVGLYVLQAAWVIYGPGQAVWQMMLLIGSHLALFFLLLLNHHVPGAKLFALGVILNTTVMVVNGGWMPATPETHQFVSPDGEVELYAKPPGSKNIILPRSETRLWILSDIIRVNLPWLKSAVSIGDLLVILGAAQFIFLTGIRKKNVAREVGC
jgi:hypothetical protein